MPNSLKKGRNFNISLPNFINQLGPIGNSRIALCCFNLKPMYGSEKEDCGLPNVPGDIGTCGDCGDGICEQENNENKCNCPQDCSEIKTTTEKPIIKDCGTLGVNDINGTEEVKECFELAFKDCRPAKMVTSAAGLATYYYEIIGLNNNSCIVKSKFFT